MGSYQPIADPNPLTLGVPGSRGASNQQSRPVPFVAGRVRIAATWMSDPFLWTAQTYTGGGKSGGSGYNFFSNIACLLCRGPVDAIFGLYMNNNFVWPQTGVGNGGIQSTPGLSHGAASFIREDIQFHGVVVDSSGNQETVNPPYDIGTMILHWGTDTDFVDALLYQNRTHLLNDNTSLKYDTPVPIVHPPYRGFCYIVWSQMQLGLNQTSFPNIEAVVGRWPTPDWWPAGVAVNINNDCNPVAIIADLMQNARGGLGIPDSMLNVAVLSAAATQLANEGFGLSVCLDREEPLKDVITRLCEYFDGYPYFDDHGLFCIGLNRPLTDTEVLPAANIGGVRVEIDETMFVKRPTFEGNDWCSTPSEVRVTFKNINLDLTDDYAAWRSSGNRAVNDQIVQPLTLDRPFITNPNLAVIVATLAGLKNSVPTKPGKVTLRRVLIDGADLYTLLPVGTLFQMDYEPRNLANIIWRVTDRTINDPAVPEFDISFEADLSHIYPVPSSGVPQIAASSHGDASAGAGPPSLVNVRLFEVPLALCPNGKPAIAILAARSDPTQTSLTAWLGRNYEQAWTATS